MSNEEDLQIKLKDCLARYEFCRAKMSQQDEEIRILNEIIDKLIDKLGSR